MTPDTHAAAGTLSANAVPDPSGRFGPYGGRYVPETLLSALEELDCNGWCSCPDFYFRHYPDLQHRLERGERGEPLRCKHLLFAREVALDSAIRAWLRERGEKPRREL